ncbi:hypothetical protein jhhlp_005359 [Lomentospora prolificans]|uniref:Sulfotransferase domain-containing protein n=1 Tax=Lomentospora prolificans TaxID=41688 RepID=A0A2N3N6P3_9PEZI|nr:hypothetical protein jhhlp_005359 [Lomentospora prolificans]
MSRLVDSLPEPARVRDKKVIVLSRSRMGTFSLYQALAVLGYKPYHMAEALKNGENDLIMMEQAMRCKFLGGGKPYGKPEFDKWLANYDAIIEIPQFFIPEFVDSYPDAKFILTERDIDSWATSFRNTAGKVFEDVRHFPWNVTRLLDPLIAAFCDANTTWDEVIFVTATLGQERRPGSQDQQKRINYRSAPGSRETTDHPCSW